MTQTNASFTIVGARPTQVAAIHRAKPKVRAGTIVSAVLLAIIVLGCLLCDLFISEDPAHMDLLSCDIAPCRAHPFGTDSMGRDLFSMVWYGGRISLLIGFAATVLSTAIAVLFGTLVGLSPRWLDALLMRGTEIFLSIPNLLIIVLVQAIFGKANVLSISFVIGITSWAQIAKVVRGEVRRLRGSEYVIAARCMGGGFFHLLWQHLLPNFVSSVMFMVVMNVRGAIVAESTLSFMGIGLPVETVTWGSMLSLSEGALLTGSWWVIVIPGAFLIATLMCVTNLGNALRRSLNRGESRI